MAVIKRRPPRLDLVYADQPVYFVTFCTRNRKEIPSLDSAKVALEKYVHRAIEKLNTALGRYVIMPDHVHLFVCVDVESLLSQWVGGLKRAMAVAVSTARLWQPGFFDHVLRSDEPYSEKWEYERENPVRAGLVEAADDWPYQGEIVLIDRA
jgi:REP element-mobilizing transposase RayT